jgi:two-component system LytT family response regulator
VDYLLKPYDFERFAKAIQRIIKAKEQKSNSADQIMGMLKDWKSPTKVLDVIWVNKSGKIMPVHMNKVEYLESDGNYVTLHTEQERFLLRQSLKEIHEQLDQTQFIRVHKSFIINKDMIQELLPKSHGDLIAVLKSQRDIPVSRNYRGDLLGK